MADKESSKETFVFSLMSEFLCTFPDFITFLRHQIAQNENQ